MYKIEKAAVVGAGTMGLGIAGQLANAGVEVLLLDLPGSTEQRNAPAERALKRLMDPNQPGLLHEDYLARISIGNIEDDMHRLADADWITEAVIERLDVKKALYKQIDKVRKAGSIVSSNTSTIPVTVPSNPSKGHRATQVCMSGIFRSTSDDTCEIRRIRIA